MARRAIGLAVVVLLCAAQAAGAQDRSQLKDELDIFAAAFFDKIQIKSIMENVEYCGYFGIDADGKIAATRAKRGLRDSCEPEEPPIDFDILASYHTHGAHSVDADIEVPSVEDMLADIDEGIDGYIATPGGRMWLNLIDEEVAYMLCGPGCVTADARFRECQAFLPEPDYTLRELEIRAENDPGYC